MNKPKAGDLVRFKIAGVEFIGQVKSRVFNSHLPDSYNTFVLHENENSRACYSRVGRTVMIQPSDITEILTSLEQEE